MKHVIAILTSMWVLAASAMAAENQAYALKGGEGGAIVVTHKPTGAAATFRPVFTVVHSAADPRLTNKGKIVEPWRKGTPFNFVVPQWRTETDFFKTGATRTTHTAPAAEPAGDGFAWTFPTQNGS